MRFLNAELSEAGRPLIANERVVDTLAVARRKHPGAPNQLDALCDRYRIDRSRRVFHGALLDCELLVEVYFEFSGGRQKSLGLLEPGRAVVGLAANSPRRERPEPLAPRLTEAELEAHRRHIEGYGEGAYWWKYAVKGERKAG